MAEDSQSIGDQSIYEQGFARVAAVSVPVKLADADANASEIIDAAAFCATQGAALVVFPEMSVTGYSIDDLVEQNELLESVVAAIDRIAAETAALSPILVVGAPLLWKGALYNCAVVLQRGRVIGVTPKSYLPSYREFYDKRYYSTMPPGGTPAEMAIWENGLRPVTLLGHPAKESADTAASGAPGSSVPHAIPFGAFQIQARDIPGFRLAVEVCEDLWVPVPPSSIAALQGATVIANPSASPVTVGRARRREDLVVSQSAAIIGAYVYTAAGFGESSNDLSWDGQALIAQEGTLLAQSERFSRERTVTMADVDLRSIARQRLVQHTFANNAERLGVDQTAFALVDVVVHPERDVLQPGTLILRRNVDRFPFFAGDQDKVDVDCYEAFNIQTSALVRRMVSVGSPKLVIGVSGGLDSTHALLVAVKAMDSLGRARSDILAYTLPGFGTSKRTRDNAEKLCKALGVTFQEVDIRPAAQAMLQAMGHPAGHGEPVYDVAFENVQAGLRTDYLFRLAGQNGGFVVGTGDMSELALGWCTYGVGDQMSHYGVNAGLPKTMIQHLVRWVSKHQDFATNHHDSAEGLPALLESILDTEISPELVPTHSDVPEQSTQSIVGPYELQDFTLYYLLRDGATPRRIAYLQSRAWGDKYSDAEILKWLEVFHRRFFTNQYKRTAVPNSPKIMGAGSLSPRGDWRMPSDALASTWMREIEELKAQFDQSPRDGRGEEVASEEAAAGEAP